jgi:hypothetical protein
MELEQNMKIEQITNLNIFEYKQIPKLNKFWKLNKNSKLKKFEIEQKF